MVSCSEQPIGEQMPPFDVLDFVKKEVGDISINGAYGLQDVVQIVRSELGQRLVIEINVSERNAGVLHCLTANDRFA